MKKLLLLITMLTFIGMIGVNGQSQKIIEENFQEWDPTETTNPDTCWLGNINEPYTTRTMDIITSSGFEEIEVTLIMVVIMPECDSRRIQRNPPGQYENLPGVTTGWVQLNKLTDEFNTVDTWEDSNDTIGEFIFGPVPQIDSIRFAHSNTGGNRGIRVYKSHNGVDWDNASPDDEFWDGDDCQLGDVNTVVINETDVYIKFTSGFDDDSPYESQYSRLHNIDVYGVPGQLTINVNDTEEDILNIYPVPAKDFVNIKLASEAINSELQIIDLVGRTVYSGVLDQQTSRIDISSLNSGMYFIQIISDNDKYVKQLIVK